jgi:hypothetical protein
VRALTALTSAQYEVETSAQHEVEAGEDRHAEEKKSCLVKETAGGGDIHLGASSRSNRNVRPHKCNITPNVENPKTASGLSVLGSVRTALIVGVSTPIATMVVPQVFTKFAVSF